MSTFRLPKERIDQLADQVASALGTFPGVQLKNAEEAKTIFRLALAENLREEHEIEQEALALLKQHGQEIYAANADFQKMLQDGKKILAKKKGFVL